MVNTELSEPSSGKKRKNATKACLNCRRRKTKCEGQPPAACPTCTLYQDDCTWGAAEDGRKPVSRQYVQSLRDRIKVLEDLLQSKVDGMPLGASQEVDAEEEDSEEDIAGEDVPVMLHLQEGELGEQLHYHGPTSVYAHAQQGSRPVQALPTEQGDTPRNYRRFLPKMVKLSSEEHSLVLDRYFRYYASWCLRGSPRLFHSDMIKAVSSLESPNFAQNSYYSPLLHNAILSIALIFSDDERLRRASTRALFVAEGDKYLSFELSRPTLATVQALAVRASYRSTLGDHLGGWIAHGLADRAALSLGLQVDCTPFVKAGRITKDEMRLRNETFWSIFMQDQTWAVYAGRPHPLGDHSTPLPTIDKEFDRMQWCWDESPADGPPMASQDCVMSVTFHETAKLAIIMEKIMLSVYSLKSDHSKLVKDGLISRLSLELDTWHENLPPELCLSGHSNRNALPHVLMLQMAREWAVLLLFRSYYRAIAGTSKGSDGGEPVAVTAMKRCDRSASRINNLMEIYHDRFGLRFTTPTALNMAFQAGTAHLHASKEHRSPKAKAEAGARALDCVRHLRLMAMSWPAAAHNADILEQSIRQQIGQADAGAGDEMHPTADSLANRIELQAISSERPVDSDELFSQFISWPAFESVPVLDSSNTLDQVARRLAASQSDWGSSGIGWELQSGPTSSATSILPTEPERASEALPGCEPHRHTLFCDQPPSHAAISAPTAQPTNLSVDDLRRLLSTSWSPRTDPIPSDAETDRGHSMPISNEPLSLQHMCNGGPLATDETGSAITNVEVAQTWAQLFNSA